MTTMTMTDKSGREKLRDRNRVLARFLARALRSSLRRKTTRRLDVAAFEEFLHATPHRPLLP